MAALAALVYTFVSGVVLGQMGAPLSLVRTGKSGRRTAHKLEGEFSHSGCCGIRHRHARRRRRRLRPAVVDGCSCVPKQRRQGRRHRSPPEWRKWIAS